MKKVSCTAGIVYCCCQLKKQLFLPVCCYWLLYVVREACSNETCLVIALVRHLEVAGNSSPGHWDKYPVHRDLPGLLQKPLHYCKLNVFVWPESTALAICWGSQICWCHGDRPKIFGGWSSNVQCMELMAYEGLWALHGNTVHWWWCQGTYCQRQGTVCFSCLDRWHTWDAGI